MLLLLLERPRQEPQVDRYCVLIREQLLRNTKATDETQARLHMATCWQSLLPMLLFRESLVHRRIKSNVQEHNRVTAQL